MSVSGTIPVIQQGGCSSNLQIAFNAVPVLHEIRHALEKLARSGEPTTIDLSSIPFGPGDRDQLFDVLGKGEVKATIAACSMGDTEITETRFPGVWLVRHLDVEDKELAMHIEITRMPALLVTPEEDIADSAAALEESLTETGSSNSDLMQESS